MSCARMRSRLPSERMNIRPMHGKAALVEARKLTSSHSGVSFPPLSVLEKIHFTPRPAASTIPTMISPILRRGLLLANSRLHRLEQNRRPSSRIRYVPQFVQCVMVACWVLLCGQVRGAVARARCPSARCLPIAICPPEC